MKTPEDEAFEEIERRQGGGFPAKRAMAADKLQEPEREVLKMALTTLEGWNNHGKWVWPETALEQAKRNTEEAITAIKAALAQPAQESKREWVGLTPEEILGLFDEHNLYGSKLVEFACAVEQLLKEKNG